MDTIPLPNDFSECLRLFESTGVEYLLVGGYAVNLHGYSRTTGDIDLWVLSSEGNATRVAAALRAFGFAAAEPAMFFPPGQIIRMGRPPIRLEILTKLSGVEFDDCYARREMLTIGGLTLPVIGLEDLKRNKRAAGRFKDLADVEELE